MLRHWCSVAPSFPLTTGIITLIDLLEWVHIYRISSFNITIFIPFFVQWCVCLPSIHYFTSWYFLRMFYSWFIDPTLLQPFFLLCMKLSPVIVHFSAWMHVMTSLSDSSCVIDIFMPWTWFFLRAWSDKIKLYALCCLKNNYF